MKKSLLITSVQNWTKTACLVALVASALPASAQLPQLVYQKIRTFGYGNSPAQPAAALLQGCDGNLYGTTASGGTESEGTVFVMDRFGYNFTVLHHFGASGFNNDGTGPVAAVVEGSGGKLFGTTPMGGSAGRGTLYFVDKTGTNYAVLHHFGAVTGDGASPYGALVKGNDGRLYGTTQTGGSANLGTIFGVNQDGTGYAILHSFTRNGDGRYPLAGLLQASDGRLYGTTYTGGADNLGTIFSIDWAGTNYHQIRSLDIRLQGEARNPRAALVESCEGVLYGTGQFGGTVNNGAIFSLNKDGTGYRVLYSLGAGGFLYDGRWPKGALVEGKDGRFYGTTENGGSFAGGGVIFSIDKDGRSYSVLRSFSDSDGMNPVAGLILGSNGKFYGTAQYRGSYSYNAGTVFEFYENRAPVADDQNITIEGNTSTNLTLVATDPDENAVYYSIETQPEHGIVTNLNSYAGTVTYIPANGYTGKDSFVFTASDGSLSDTGTVFIEVQISSVAPTNLTLSSQSVYENSGVGATVGTLLAEDANNGDTFSYALVTGTGDTDNASFTLSGDTLLTATNFNFEARSNYTVRVEVTDGAGLTYATALTITVLNTNEAPYSLSLYGNTVSENQSAGTGVGDFTAQDVDAGDTLAFSLVSGEGDTDNGSFYLVDNKLVTGASFDYEAKSTYSVRVRVTDAGGLYTESYFYVYVGNVNEPLTADNQTVTVLEGTTTNLVLTANDEDGGPVTFAILSNPTNGVLGNLNGATGAVDYTPDGGYVGPDAFTFTATDGSLLSTGTVNIAVILTNHPPTDLSLNNYGVTENEPAGTVVGTFFPSDVNLDDTFTYALVSGSGDLDNALFAVNGANLVTAEPLNYEYRSSYYVRARVTDGAGQSYERYFYIYALNTNDAPASLNLNGNTVTENRPTGTVVGTFAADEEDSGDTNFYTLVSGDGDTDNGSFTIVGNQLQTAATFDYEGQNQRSIRVRVTDIAGASSEQSFIIYIGNENEAPVAIGQNLSVPQDLATNLTLFASDPENDTLSFTILDNPTNGYVTNFNGATGELTYVPTPNFVGDDAFTFTVSDGSLSATGTVSLTVHAVNHAPTNLFLYGSSFPENQSVGTTVGTLAAADQDPNESFTYALVAGTGGDDNASFTIVSNQLKTATSFDYETRSSYTVRIQVQDSGGLTYERIFPVSVIDIFEIPPTPPILTITTPKSGSRSTNPVVNLAGKATDNFDVQQVVYSLNGGPYVPINLASNGPVVLWDIDVTPPPGTNTLQVYALDNVGTPSLIKSITFFQVVPWPLTLAVNGDGTLTGKASAYGTPADGALLEIGRGYSITAKPGVGSVFSNWVDGASSDQPVLNFIMQSNLTLTANFIANPFIPAAGLYSGLFYEGNSVTHESAGYITLKVKTNLAYSGKIYLDGNALGFSGKFKVPGNADRAVLRQRLGKSDLSISLQLLFGQGQLMGSVNTTNWSANLYADRAHYSAANPATAYTGRSTALLNDAYEAGNGGNGGNVRGFAPPPPAPLPIGYGYGTIDLRTNGYVVFAGGTADGRKLSRKVPISQSGAWPLYVPLYKTVNIYTNLVKNEIALNREYRGFVLGWMQAGSTYPGILSWIRKPDATNTYYPAGFQAEVEPLASAYVAPVKGQRLFSLDSGYLTLTDGNLSQPLVSSFLLSTNNKVTFGSTNGTLKLTFTEKTGLLHGTFRHPDNTNAVTSFQGVVLQDFNLGGGSFLGTNVSGKVELIPGVLP